MSISAGAPAAKASLPPRRSASQVAERCRRVVEEHHAEATQHHVEGPGPERMHLGVGHVEPDVGDAGTGGEPARPVLGLLRIHRHDGHARC